MSTIICGDLHGKLSVAKDLLSDPKQSAVFVGDYLDSFSASVAHQIELLELILDAATHRDNVTALAGNHELSYLDEKMVCSGFKVATAAAVLPLASQMRNVLKRYTIVNDFLVTHAGVSRTWLPDRFTTLDQIVGYLKEAPNIDLYAIGYSRGGHASCGGIYWCDYWDEFESVAGVKQVFGHTAYRPRDKTTGIYTADNENFNVDCLDWTSQVLEISEESVKIVEV